MRLGLVVVGSDSGALTCALIARGIEITTAAVRNLELHSLDNLSLDALNEVNHVRMHRNVDFIPRLWYRPKKTFFCSSRSSLVKNQSFIGNTCLVRRAKSIREDIDSRETAGQ